MSFLDEADTLRSKLHLSTLSSPLRIGIVVVCALVLFILFQGLWQLGSGDSFLAAGQAQGSEQSSEEGLVITSEEDAQDSGAEGEAVATIAVHVVGAVNSPGLYQIEQDSRVGDAIEAAGGLAEDADQSSVNLARVVEDGEQVVVVSKNAQAQTATSSAAQSGATSASSSASGLVNINTADAAALCTLSGIGESTAQKIIADREKNGPFKTKKDITRVSGIGDKKYEAIADSITV